MQTRNGLLSAITAYFLWGILPLYWKLLKEVSAFEILCNRTIWSLFFMICLLSLKKNLRKTITKAASKKTLLLCFFSGSLLSINWLTFIWAVNHGYVMECSLGYFIAPPLNVCLGMLVFKEKLSKLHLCAVILATLGVINQTVAYGSFPTIAIILATTFVLYGLARKKSSFSSLEGLLIETMLMFPAAIIAYGYFLTNATNSIIEKNSTLEYTLLMFSGPLTAIPLLFFARGAREIPMSTLGLLQFIAPSIQFLLALYIFKEHFSEATFTSFTFIWTGLILYSAELYRQQQFYIKTKSTSPDSLTSA